MRSVCLIAGLLFLAGAASAQTITYTPQQIIAARQASLDMSAATFGGMYTSAKAGTDAKKLSRAAKALSLWAKVLPTLFPAGTGPEQSAMPTKIWSDNAGFEKAAANYIAATESLSAHAEAGDTAGFAAQLTAVDQACDACHKSYRAR